MSCHTGETLLLLFRLPHMHREVVGATHKDFAPSVKCLLIALLSIGLHGLAAFLCRSVKAALRMIKAARAQDVVRAQSKTVDPVSVARQFVDTGSCVGAPDFY